MLSPTAYFLQSELSIDGFDDDVTGALLGTESRPCLATIVAKQAGVFSGSTVCLAAKELFFGTLEIETLKKEGERFQPKEVLVRLKGQARDCLALERTLVNFISHLSGVATFTDEFAEALKGSSTKLLATRKTLPGLRELQLRAVVAGGGKVHRRSLSDGILIKENHQRFLSDEALIAAAKRKHSPLHKIEIEVQDLEQLDRILKNPPDLILLDNLGNEDLKEAIRRIDKRCEIEISGGVNLKRLPFLASLGVDYISVGALTHSVVIVDMSMDFFPEI